MSVRYPLASIDATSIATQVKTTLQYYRSISALHAQVETNHDVVRLEGKARNTAEKDLVAELVSDINGV
jgi:osmotically-inducible protein OsmY